MASGGRMDLNTSIGSRESRRGYGQGGETVVGWCQEQAREKLYELREDREKEKFGY